MRQDEDTRLWGDEDTQPEDPRDIAERPTVRWIRIAHKEPAPATLRDGSRLPEPSGG